VSGDSVTSQRVDSTDVDSLERFASSAIARFDRSDGKQLLPKELQCDSQDQKLSISYLLGLCDIHRLDRNCLPVHWGQGTVQGRPVSP
jgi:hypothetical protein